MPAPLHLHVCVNGPSCFLPRAHLLSDICNLLSASCLACVRADSLVLTPAVRHMADADDSRSAHFTLEH